MIVGEGKANITAVKGTDGTYLPMPSENYIRITVEDNGAAADYSGAGACHANA